MKNVTIGIYLITERATGRDVYVGQGIVYRRWRHHQKKFPKDCFDYRVLLECPRTELDFWEQHYIRVLKTHWTEGGENQTWGGQYWPRPEEPLSPATRAKISAALKGRVAPNKGVPMSEETKAKLKGRTHSEESRAKQSASQKGRPGRVQSEEEKAKRRGRVMPEEERAKLSAALKGRVQSEEEKAKRSAAAKARWALKRAAKAAAEAALEALLIAEIISTSE